MYGQCLEKDSSLVAELKPRSYRVSSKLPAYLQAYNNTPTFRLLTYLHFFLNQL